MNRRGMAAGTALVRQYRNYREFEQCWEHSDGHLRVTLKEAECQYNACTWWYLTVPGSTFSALQGKKDNFPRNLTYAPPQELKNGREVCRRGGDPGKTFSQANFRNSRASTKRGLLVG